MASDEIGASEQSPSAETDALPQSVPLDSDITASQVDRSLLPPPPGTARLGILLTIGDIGITTDSIVTPNGSAPLAGSQWIFTDRTNVEQKIPGWAIILAIVFGLACGVGLLFLLVKDTRITGYAEVSVRSESLLHMTQLPVRSQLEIPHYRAMVGQAQTLAASAAARRLD